MAQTTIGAVPEATRERVLAVALQLFADQGFAATSTRQVCERMGFTKAALWYHFRSKDELLTALLTPVGDSLRLLADGTPVAGDDASRRASVAGYVQLVETHADLMRLIYDDPSLRRHAAVAPSRETWKRVLLRFAGTATADRAALARARAAMGAVNAVLLRGDADDDLQQLRNIALDAGCRALGLTD